MNSSLAAETALQSLQGAPLRDDTREGLRAAQGIVQEVRFACCLAHQTEADGQLEALKADILDRLWATLIAPQKTA